MYVLYAYDAAIGGTAPRWGTAGATSDGCPSPPGATADGCVVSGRLSRLTALGNSMTGPEQVLIEDWCQQYPSHSIGSLDFGPDGALYVTGGDGASFNFVDYGQDGSPLNPCGDPPGGVGAVLTPPTAEGGALRSQDLRTLADPTSLDGACCASTPDRRRDARQPERGSLDPNARRIVAYGMRNPFRIGGAPRHRRGLDRRRGLEHLGGDQPHLIPDRADEPRLALLRGPGRQSGYDSANLSICENLFAAGKAPCTRRCTRGTTTPRSCRAKAVRPEARRPPGSRSEPRTAPTRPNIAARCSSPITHATASGR